MRFILGDSLVSTGGKVRGSDEGIKPGCTDSKVLGTILVNLDGITLGLDVGTEVGYIYGIFYGSNYGKLKGFFCGITGNYCW